MLRNDPFDKDRIRETLKNRRNYFNSWSCDNLDKFFGENIDERNFKHNLVWSLVFELIQDYKIEEFLSDEEISEYVNYFFSYCLQRAARDDFSYPFSRIFARRYGRFISGKIDYKGNYKPYKDLVDSELFHYSIYGMKFNQRFKKVKIFTMENKKTIEDRLAFFKAVLIHMGTNDYYKELMKEVPTKMGIIYHFNIDPGEVYTKTFVKDILIDWVELRLVPRRGNRKMS